MKLNSISFRQFVKIALKEGILNAVRIKAGSIKSKVKPFKINSNQLKKAIYLRSGSSDIRVFQQVLIYQQYRIDSMPFKPKFIIDAGANIGISTLYLHHKFPKAQILAIEPDKRNYELLELNTRGIENIECLNSALWPVEANVSIVDEGFGFWGLQVKDDEDGSQNLRTITIDNILHKYNLDEIDLLKMDIEGAEKEIFNEEITWIKKIKILIIELHDDLLPGTSHAVLKVMTKGKFNLAIKGENLLFTRFDLGRAK